MEVPKEADETEVTEIEEGQKSTKNNEVGEITLEQFKTALESNLEIKGYYDSVVLLVKDLIRVLSHGKKRI